MDWTQDLHGSQALVSIARDLGDRQETLVTPVRFELDRRIDKRLVGTFLSTLQGIAQLRQGTQGLLLSKLGSYLLSLDGALAGAK